MYTFDRLLPARFGRCTDAIACLRSSSLVDRLNVSRFHLSSGSLDGSSRSRTARRSTSSLSHSSALRVDFVHRLSICSVRIGRRSALQRQPEAISGRQRDCGIFVSLDYATRSRSPQSKAQASRAGRNTRSAGREIGRLPETRERSCNRAHPRNPGSTARCQSATTRPTRASCATSRVDCPRA